MIGVLNLPWVFRASLQAWIVVDSKGIKKIAGDVLAFDQEILPRSRQR